MKKFWQVFLFHFRDSIISKSSLIMSAILFLISFGVFAFGHFAGDGSNEEAKVTVISESSQYVLTEDELDGLVDGVTFTVEEPTSIKDVKEDVSNGDVDSLIIINEQDGVPTLTHIYNNNGSSDAIAATAGIVQQQFIAKTIAENNVSSEAAAKILTEIQIKDAPLQDQMAIFGISYIFGFILYLFLAMFGASIASSIVLEKSSRVMEVMISKVKPMYMLYAKVFAVFCSAIVQFLVLGAGFALAYLLGWVDMQNISFLGMEIDFSSLGWEIIAALIVFFILGYLLYGMMYAAVGSLVSRVEDLQMVSMPITFLIMGAFFIMIKSLSDPTATIVVISSYIPFFSPLVTFSRFVAGEAGAMEMSISIGITIVTIAIITVLASRIYVNGVMYYGEKLKWKEIGRFLKRH